jgi:hypothetical protein
LAIALGAALSMTMTEGILPDPLLFEENEESKKDTRLFSPVVPAKPS